MVKLSLEEEKNIEILVDNIINSPYKDKVLKYLKENYGSIGNTISNLLSDEKKRLTALFKEFYTSDRLMRYFPSNLIRNTLMHCNDYFRHAVLYLEGAILNKSDKYPNEIYEDWLKGLQWIPYGSCCRAHDIDTWHIKDNNISNNVLNLIKLVIKSENGVYTSGNRDYSPYADCCGISVTEKTDDEGFTIYEYSFGEKVSLEYFLKKFKLVLTSDFIINKFEIIDLIKEYIKRKYSNELNNYANGSLLINDPFCIDLLNKIDIKSDSVVNSFSNQGQQPKYEDTPPNICAIYIRFLLENGSITPDPDSFFLEIAKKAFERSSFYNEMKDYLQLVTKGNMYNYIISQSVAPEEFIEKISAIYDTKIKGKVSKFDEDKIQNLIKGYKSKNNIKQSKENEVVYIKSSEEYLIEQLLLVGKAISASIPPTSNFAKSLNISDIREIKDENNKITGYYYDIETLPKNTFANAARQYIDNNILPKIPSQFRETIKTILYLALETYTRSSKNNTFSQENKILTNSDCITRILTKGKIVVPNAEEFERSLFYQELGEFLVPIEMNNKFSYVLNPTKSIESFISKLREFFNTHKDDINIASSEFENLYQKFIIEHSIIRLLSNEKIENSTYLKFSSLGSYDGFNTVVKETNQAEEEFLMNKQKNKIVLPKKQYRYELNSTLLTSNDGIDTILTFFTNYWKDNIQSDPIILNEEEFAKLLDKFKNRYSKSK